MYETWYKMTVMLQSGLNLRPVITHRFPYAEYEKGFEVMLSGRSARWCCTGGESTCLCYSSLQAHLEAQLRDIRDAGTHKHERVITTPQGARVAVTGGRPVLNLCANNYLGLAKSPRSRAAAHEALDRWGFGLPRSGFICGTQAIHKELERVSARSSARRTLFSTHRVGMRTGGSSRRCSVPRTL